MRAVSRVSRRRPNVPVSGWLAAGSAAAVLLLPTPYILEGPGPAIDVLGEHGGRPVMSVEGGAEHPGEGRLDMTTMLVSGPPGGTTTAAEALAALADPTTDAVPRDLVHPTGVSAEEVGRANEAAMTSSQDVATVAALRSLGRDVPGQLTVQAFTPDSPAAGALREGDAVLRAGGEPVRSVDDVRTAVEAAAPDPVTLTVRREGREQDIEVPVAAAPAGSERAWQIGVLMDERFEVPVEVDFALEDVGGPSAGTVFALAVIERLTPGALTGGAHVAVTVPVTADGRVGAIGGIAQKVRGAADAGATAFLAPAENCAELAGRVPEGIDVYAVDTLDTARRALEELGRGQTPDGVPPCG